MTSFDDFRDICDLRYRYATGVDTRDWALHRSVFCDVIEMDFSSYDSHPGSRMTADEWVARIRPLFKGLAASQHSMSNPRVIVDGDTAVQVMYMQAEHLLEHQDPNSWFTIGGYYTDQLVRTTDGWRIAAVTLTVLWRRGRPEIMKTAVKRGLTVYSVG
jgi:hypothetical protein